MPVKPDIDVSRCVRSVAGDVEDVDLRVFRTVGEDASDVACRHLHVDVRGGRIVRRRRAGDAVGEYDVPAQARIKRALVPGRGRRAPPGFLGFELGRHDRWCRRR